MSQPLLKCEHVDFGYENYDVVKDVSLEICQGDYLCIVGENGSGKSTLMKGLLGLLKPTGGSLMVSDDLKRSGIGYLPQQTPAQKDFPATVQEVVISGCLGKRGNRPFYSKKERETAAGASGDHRSEKELLPGSFRRPEAEDADRQGPLCHRPPSDPGRAHHRAGSLHHPGLLPGDPPFEPGGAGGRLNGVPRYPEHRGPGQ